MKALRVLMIAVGMFACASPYLCAQKGVDTDHDGLDDVLEQALLERFKPTLMIGEAECAVLPARWTPGVANPVPLADDGTLYGQAFPVAHGRIELHYYALWRVDCGRMGHPLDTEHVAALLDAPQHNDRDARHWAAQYWYAAAHEDTVCDASQLTRASTLKAADRGPAIWISEGKHASFLAAEMCDHGCGGDLCRNMRPVVPPQVVNVGETGHVVNGAAWIVSPRWPGGLLHKMGRTDFSDADLKRLERLPESDIAWANPELRPAHATIFAGSVTVDSLAMSDRKTNTALVLAGDRTGNALGTSYRKTKGAVGHALGSSLHAVGDFLGGKKDSADQK